MFMPMRRVVVVELLAACLETSLKHSCQVRTVPGTSFGSGVAPATSPHPFSLTSSLSGWKVPDSSKRPVATPQATIVPQNSQQPLK